MRIQVTINDLDDGFHALLAPYLGPMVHYRRGWRFSALGPGDNYDYEVFAEATCEWERRLDTRLVLVLHAADNFIVPLHVGEDVRSALRRFDARTFSGAHIPTIQAFKPRGSDTGRTVLERWSLLGEEFEFKGGRTVPLVNPRHVTHTWVHWNVGRTADFRANMEQHLVIESLGLHVVHIMALARPGMNVGNGTVSPAYRAAAAQLGDLMERGGARVGP
jgi:hypothetical protein